MANGAEDGFSEISGTLDTLNSQLQNFRQKIILANGKLSGLREENQTLVHQGTEKDHRIKQLESECKAANEEASKLRLEAWRNGLAVVSGGTPQEPNVTKRAELETRHSIGGFTLLPKWHQDYRDIFEGSGNEPKVTALRGALLTWKASKVQTVVLREHRWELREISSTLGDCEDGVSQNDDLQPTSPPPKLEPNSTPLHCNLVHKQSSEVDHNKTLHRASTTPKCQRDTAVSDPRQIRLQDGSFKRNATRGKRAGKRSRPIDAMISEADHRRKSICLRCWETGGCCDTGGQCKTCRNKRATCIHRLCRDGLSCRNTCCLCLHPGQWDEKDRDFIVEEGGFPEKHGGRRAEKRRRASGDFYRPDEDESEG